MKFQNFSIAKIEFLWRALNFKRGHGPPGPPFSAAYGCKSSRSRSKPVRSPCNGKGHVSGVVHYIHILAGRLEDNYEISDGVCLPRSVLYNHYQDFCKRNAMEPVGAASFGKVC